MRLPRARIFVASMVVALLALAGCAASNADRPSVVVTTNILGDVVTELVGDEADVFVLMAPGADPHSFGISAQDAARLARADLIVSNGLGLEEGVQHHVDAAVSDGVASFVVGEVIDALHFDHEDSSGAPDPHFWTDPDRMLVAVEALSRQIGDLPGIDTAAISRHADAYEQQLHDLTDEMDAAFSAIPADRRALVTNHHVFGYLADRFDFTIVGAVIPSGTTLAAPSASDLASLSAAVRTAGVSAIFADSSQPDRLAQVIASEAGIRVRVIALFTESLTAPGQGAATYLEMMRANTTLIVSGLTDPL